MVRFVSTGDIFEEHVEALVNTVNCVGVMGRGVALQFKNRFPLNFKLYEAACKRGEVQPGRMFVTNNDMLGVKWIINFPTKRHWRYPSRFDDIDRGLDSLVSEIRDLGIRSIALPPLGCGLGGLDWVAVKETIFRKLSVLDNVDVVVFEPNDRVVRQTVSAKEPMMTFGRAVFLCLCDRYINEGMLDFEFTLLEAHKLLYFVQASGLDLRLTYEKAVAGPFATNLGNVLKHIEGYYVNGYNDGGDSPCKVLSLVPGAVRRAADFLETQQRPWRYHVERVLDLIGGNGDAAYLELLASVHWVCTNEMVVGVQSVLAALWNWNERKRRFSAPQVELAYRHLLEQGWLVHSGAHEV